MPAQPVAAGVGADNETLVGGKTAEFNDLSVVVVCAKARRAAEQDIGLAAAISVGRGEGHVVITIAVDVAE